MVVVLLVSCENPFTPQPSEDEALFRLEATFSGESRLIQKIPITLTWSEVTIEDFSGYRVFRSVGMNGEGSWEQRAEISNPLQVSFVDTVDDDLTYRYRVRIEDADGNYRVADTDPLVFSTTHLLVPDEIGSLQAAYDSPFIDTGDTLWVAPGTYSEAYRFTHKAVLVQSVEGRDVTILERGQTAVSISQGTLRGFTVRKGRVSVSGTALLDDCVITGVFAAGYPSAVMVSGDAEVRNCLVMGNEKTGYLGAPGNGAGMRVQGNATIRNCRISDNRTAGKGGGLFISGEPTIVNTIVDRNYAAQGGGGMAIDLSSRPTLINCVLFGNRSGLANGDRGAIFFEKGSLTLLNSIIWKNSGDHPRWTWSNASYSDIQTFSDGTGNISVSPRFVDSGSGDFHLSSDSPCIDTGHPGDVYRDVDGSRNDMGAYGGPYGEWP